MGQLLLVPLQDSGASQVLAEGRHTPVFFPSEGQLFELPVHFSAASHTPAAERHTVEEEA